MNLYDFFDKLDALGIRDVLLPFLLIFTIVYAVLYRTQVLGDPKKPFNKIIALVIAASVIFPHITGIGPDVIPTINNALPQVSLILVAVIMFLILMGVWGVNIDIAGKSFGGWVVILSFLAVAFIFASSAGWLPFIPGWLTSWIDDETLSLAIIILIFGVIISFVTGEDDEIDKKESRMKMFDEIMGKAK